MSDIPGVHDDDMLDPEHQIREAQREETEGERREDDTRKLAERRMHAYIRVFKGGTPTKEDRDIVMLDLERFTRGESTPWHADARIHCVLTGRHEVWTRIKDHITLGVDDFVVKYQSKQE